VGERRLRRLEEGNWCEVSPPTGRTNAYKADQGAREAASYRRGELQKFLNFVSESEDFPLVEFRSRSDASTQAVGYSKGMMVFHMLRREIGETAFRDGERILFRTGCSSRPHGRTSARRSRSERRRSLRLLPPVDGKEGGASPFALGRAGEGGTGRRYEVEGTVRQEPPVFRVDVPVRVETETGPDSLVVYLTGEKKEFKGKGAGSRPRSPSIRSSISSAGFIGRRSRRPFRRLSAPTRHGSSFPRPGATEADSALAALARSWASRPGIRTTREKLPAEVFARSTVWLLGPTVYDEEFAAALPEGASWAAGSWTMPDGVYDAGTHSAVVTLRHPADPSLSWSLFYPENADVVPSLGGRSRHYGKYGYLVFEGTENVAKGEWGAAGSPLRVELAR